MSSDPAGPISSLWCPRGRISRLRSHGTAARAVALAAMLSSFAGGLPARAEPTADSARTGLQVKGSDTIGEHLGQALAKAYMAANPDVAVAWESLGSSTAFVGLLDGSADLGASSRAVRAGELEQARAVGVEIAEYVIGYDGIAVVAHSSNPVESLALEQLGAVFRGEITQWSDVGGEPRPIRLVSRPSYSGTHGFFSDAVVKRAPAPPDAELCPTTEYVEETDEILEIVARDPRAVSYVGLGFVAGHDVRVLALSDTRESAPALPAVESIRNGTYPIYRPLYIYARTDIRPEASLLLRFILSPPGQREVAAHGFVAPDVASAAFVDVAAAPRDALEAPIRIFFAFNSVELPAGASAMLDETAARALASDGRIEVVGHSDSLGDRLVNLVVSRRRAAAAAAYLASSGVPRDRIRIEARGFDEPIATNTDPAGRGQNRRVDVRLLAR